MPQKNLYASFIGIDDYKQSPLNGCIRDVLNMDSLLRNLALQQGAGQLTYTPAYLLSPNTIDLERIAAYEKAHQLSLEYAPASFSNVSTKAFAHFKDASPGDICVLYYSGHGSQIDAPPVFWHTKSDRQNETIVCADSRNPSVPGSRDLVDKELAFLIWDALKGKDLHCLVMMDCCHSGNNMRSLVHNSDTRYRFESSSNLQLPLEQYLGYDDKGSFYTVKDGRADIKIARYVHMAAAQDTEKAQETSQGGLFTSRLLEVLGAGGAARSYRDLMQGLSITVNNRAAQQHPVAFAAVDEDLDLQFLGTGIIPYQVSYEVRYDFEKEQWKMYGGAIQGIAAPQGNTHTMVKINPLGLELPVQEVLADYSVLDGQSIPDTEKENESLRAIVTSTAGVKKRIGITADILANAGAVASIQAALAQEPPVFFEIDFTPNASNIDYMIRAADAHNLVLTLPEDDTPLFKRVSNAKPLLVSIGQVCKWQHAINLKNASPSFAAKDFVFRVEKMEAVALTAAPVAGQGAVVEPDSEIVLAYKNDLQPAFRFSIAIADDAGFDKCYVGALYLDSLYGIEPNYILPDAGELKKGNPLSLKFISGGKTLDFIPVFVDKGYGAFNINEITDTLKIVVSNQRVDLKRYKQERLQLDKPVTRDAAADIKFKGGGFEEPIVEKTEWSVFTNTIRIIRSPKQATVTAAAPASFAPFTVEVPPGFEAKVNVATAADIEKLIPAAGQRSISADPFLAAIKPPDIWGSVLTDDSPFPAGVRSAGDTSVRMLELMPLKEGGVLQLEEGKPMVLKQKQLEASRSVNATAADEVIIPYGYDTETGLYFPLGCSDDKGNIYIRQLPPPSAGHVGGNLVSTRSFGGSVKLYFKKLFFQPTNKLVLYALNADGSWNRLTDEPSKMKALLAAKPAGRVVLFTHGIIGDTKDMVASMQLLKELPGMTDFVMTYDYENMATTIGGTAKKLAADLQLTGAGTAGMPSLTLVAHSMGGLVSRWLIEKEGGKNYIKQLILVGSPCGGSEITDLGGSVGSLLTHALNVTGPIKMAVTGLCFLLKKLQLDPFGTFRELQTSSATVKELFQSKQPDGVKYWIIGGDTSLLKVNYAGNDFFLKKLRESLVKGVVYPGLSSKVYHDKPNDIAVTLDSMQTIPGFSGNGNIRIVASDHISYFQEPASQAVLLEFIAAAKNHS
jgi:pimeloyl-ACP methyl ester carboxylesterase